MSVTFFTGR